MRQRSKVKDLPAVRVADLFCGAGGSSTGLAQACEHMGVPYSLTAVNHWDVAIATHSKNHPEAKHLLTEVDQLQAGALSADGVLDILWASPSCSEHSYAKGGHNIDDQKRCSAWAIAREVERYLPAVVIVENVPPFRNWGPTELARDRHGVPKIDKHGEVIKRPIKSRRGETYRAWFAAIEALGYSGSARVINAADFGAPQSRARLFIAFTAPGIKFEWPQESHGAPGSLEVTAGLRQPWRGSREIINRDLPIQSIFDRKKPLAENTLRRIMVGAQRYWGDPFLVILRRYANARSLDLPAPTVAARAQHMGLAEVSLQQLVSSNGSKAIPRPSDSPSPTLTAEGARSYHLYEADIEPLISGNCSDAVPQPGAQPVGAVTAKGYKFVVAPELRAIVGANRTNNTPRTDEEPAPPPTTCGGIFVAEPAAFVLGQQSNSAPRDTKTPAPTVATGGKIAVVESNVIVLGQHGGGVARSGDEPLSTIATDGYVRVFETVVVDIRHGGRPHQPKVPADPLGTVTAKNGVGIGEAVAEPLAVSSAKSHGKRSVKRAIYPATDEPGGVIMLSEPSAETLASLPADAPKDRIFLGSDGILYLLDIRFRMLEPEELALAQDFPRDYKFTGAKWRKTAQIGNAVPVCVARALMTQAILALRGPKGALRLVA